MTRRATLVCSLAILVTGCSSSPSLLDCQSDADCGAGSLCHQGSCAGNEPPTASFSAPTGATTNRLVSLVPDSRDPEGRAVEHRWSVRPVAGGCDADLEPSDGPGLDVVFWCPGRYEVTLVPVDDLGAEGEPAVQSFDVEAAQGAPSVAAGPAVAASHVCDLGLPACLVTGPDGSATLQLTATGADPAGDPVTYEWTVLPPPSAASDPGLEVAFVPGSQVEAPLATISNGGGPIGGLYRFRVRVRSPRSLLAQAFQEVVVANRPPTRAPAALLLPHAYVGGRFVAEGEVETGASDPDGDLLLAEGSLDPAPPPGCSEAVTPSAGGRVHVRIECSLASALIGEAARTLSVEVADVNGASIAFSAPLAIGNEPPAILLGPAYPGALEVDHHVEGCSLATGSSCFVAAAPDPFVAVDPDGDPLSGYQLGASVTAGETTARGATTVDAEAHGFRFEAPIGAPHDFRSVDGSTGFIVRASVADPFGATATLSLPLVIRNRGPVIREEVPAISIPHEYSASGRRYLASASAALFEDPDGDPLLPGGGLGPGSFCRTVTLQDGRATISCERAWDWTLGGVPPLAPLLAPASIPVSVFDGWEAAHTATLVTVLDRPATVTAPVRSVENCTCTQDYPCWKYAATGSGLDVPVQLTDPDGDPQQVTAQLDAPLVSQPGPVVCLPGWCYPKANEAGTVARGEAVARAGTGISVQATFKVAATCAVANTCCY